MPDTLTVIGFDYGTRWIGCAVGQTQSCTASPLDAIRVINNNPQWQAIEKHINNWKPQRLVVGLPTNMAGEESKITALAKKFSRQLEGRFHIKTELVDERLTTREAWQIVENQASNFQAKQEIDSIAAVLITETWLNMQNEQSQ